MILPEAIIIAIFLYIAAGIGGLSKMKDQHPGEFYDRYGQTNALVDLLTWPNVVSNVKKQVKVNIAKQKLREIPGFRLSDMDVKTTWGTTDANYTGPIHGTIYPPTLGRISTTGSTTS